MRTVLVLLFMSSSALAQVNVSIEPGSGAQLATDLGIPLAELEAQLEADLGDIFAVVNTAQYLEAFASAQALSAKGLGVDYASNFDIFEIGFGLNLSLNAEGLDNDGNIQEEVFVAGASPNASVMLGLNLSKLGLDDIMVYGNFLTYGFSFEELDARITSAGVHAQMLFFTPEGGGWDLLFQWGGFRVTSGLEYTRLKLGLGGDLASAFDLEGDTGSVPASILSRGDLNLTSKAFVIPLEVSTSIRLLYILSIYAGLGADLRAGSASVQTELTGDLVAESPADGSDVDLGTATVSVTESSSPNAVALHYFLGLQINLWKLRVFGQVDFLADQTFSLAAGLRLGW